MPSESNQVRAYMRMQLLKLTKIENESAVRANLARLRRGIGKNPGELPELWDITLEGMPENLYSNNGMPTKAEWAVYNSLTLFALHQQGKDVKTNMMHEEGISLGKAVRTLIAGKDDESRIKRRFDAVITASSPMEFAVHIRGIVQLLKSAGIPLDYVKLAEDLYVLQIPEAKSRICLKWAEDYYRAVEDKAIVSNETEEEK